MKTSVNILTSKVVLKFLILLPAIIIAGIGVSVGQESSLNDQGNLNPDYFGGIKNSDLVRSQSQQFIVLEASINADTIKDPIKGIENKMLRLDGNLLVVMAEKVSASYYMFLGVPRKWENRVYFKINPQLEPGSDVVVQIRKLKDQTQIISELPYFIQKKKLGRLLVGIVFREFLMQHPGPYQEPPPLWVMRAFEREFLEGSLWRPLLEPNQKIHINQQFVDPLAVSHKLLNGQTPLSFEELSFPPPEALNDELRHYYDVSAHVFLRKLCELPKGKEMLLNWLKNLNKRLNWQLSFMNAYQQHFGTFLGIEKWWTIQGIKILRRNELSMLQPFESMTRLEQLLLRFEPTPETNDDGQPEVNGSSGLVEGGSPTINAPEPIKLQDYLKQSQFREHADELAGIYNRLLFLHAQSHPLVSDTIGNYIVSIDNYLSHRSGIARNPRNRAPEGLSIAALNRLIKDLNKADLIRRQTIMRSAELKFGIIPSEDLIPDKGSVIKDPKDSATQ